MHVEFQPTVPGAALGSGGGGMEAVPDPTLTALPQGFSPPREA